MSNINSIKLLLSPMATKATLEENHPSMCRCVSDWEEACLHIHLADGLVDFEKMGSTWRFFDTIMGIMVMLGCRCGILFPFLCDSVITLEGNVA